MQIPQTVRVFRASHLFQLRRHLWRRQGILQRCILHAIRSGRLLKEINLQTYKLRINIIIKKQKNTLFAVLAKRQCTPKRTELLRYCSVNEVAGTWAGEGRKLININITESLIGKGVGTPGLPLRIGFGI